MVAHTVPAILMQQMRASILVMGSLLARIGYASVGLPGGDAIGKRPIDFHLKAFRKMGAVVTEQGDMVTAEDSALKPARIALEYPSVGATENIILAALGHADVPRLSMRHSNRKLPILLRSYKRWVLQLLWKCQQRSISMVDCHCIPLNIR